MSSLLWQFASWAGIAAAAFVLLVNYPSMTSSLGPGGVASGKVTPGAIAANVATVATPVGNSTVALKVGNSGHYHAQADINGRSTAVMVDTGASVVVLTYEDARRAGVYLKPSDFTQPVATANGTTKVASVVLDRVSLGSITVRNVQAAVVAEGRLQTSLLGMSFLNRLQRVDLRHGVMILKN